MGLQLVLLAATAALAAPTLEDGTAPGFDIWKTGDGQLAYNRMMGDCEGVTHAFGRNAAWGLWKIPLEGVTVSVGAADEGAVLTFKCDAGRTCIQSGKLNDTPDRMSEHSVRYDTVDGAEAMAVRIATLRQSCRWR